MLSAFSAPNCTTGKANSSLSHRRLKHLPPQTHTPNHRDADGPLSEPGAHPPARPPATPSPTGAAGPNRGAPRRPAASLCPPAGRPGRSLASPPSGRHRAPSPAAASPTVAPKAARNRQPPLPAGEGRGPRAPAPAGGAEPSPARPGPAGNGTARPGHPPSLHLLRQELPPELLPLPDLLQPAVHRRAAGLRHPAPPGSRRCVTSFPSSNGAAARRAGGAGGHLGAGQPRPGRERGCPLPPTTPPPCSAGAAAARARASGAAWRGPGGAGEAAFPLPATACRA